MREITVKKGLLGRKTRVVLYESIKELPITRYNELQKMFLMDSDIGADMDSVLAHFGKLYTLLSSNEVNKAIQEARNLHNNFFYIINGLDFGSYAFAAMVYSIDGKEVDLLKDPDAIVDRLKAAGLTIGMVEEEIDQLKKKLITNWLPSFLLDLEMGELPIYTPN